MLPRDPDSPASSPGQAAQTDTPRWTWQSFDQRPWHWHAVLRDARPRGWGRMRSETFLLTRHTTDIVKLQRDRVDVKRRVARDPAGLEAWQTVWRAAFPLGAGEIAQLCISWGCAAVAPLPSAATLDDLHAFVARCTPSVRVLPSRSWRREYSLGGCRLRRATMLVAGSVLEMLALDHDDRDALHQTLQALRLADEENTSCLAVLRRQLNWPPDGQAAD